MIHRKRSYKNFDKLQFRADLIKFNWDSFCHDPNPNVTLEHFLKIIEKLLHKHAPYKIIKHPKSKFENKLWITPGLANSIKIKNKLYRSFCKEKDLHKKENYERHFKTFHNLYLHYLGRQKILTINNTLKTKKPLKLVWKP